MTSLTLDAAPPRPAGAFRHLRLAREFLRFGVVGTAGFLVDAGVLTAAIALGLGPWLGRLVSYVAAASATYGLNRAWTFRHRRGGARGARQWALFLVVNLGGFAANYGTYAALLAFVPLVAAHPVLGVAAGSLAGMVLNFGLSRRFVFTASAVPETPSGNAAVASPPAPAPQAAAGAPTPPRGRDPRVAARPPQVDAGANQPPNTR